jgi:hypothetical protein
MQRLQDARSRRQTIRHGNTVRAAVLSSPGRGGWWTEFVYSNQIDEPQEDLPEELVDEI